MRSCSSVFIDLQLDDGVEVHLLLGEHGIERLRLIHRAGKTVEDEAARGIRLLDPLGDDADDNVVGDEAAGIHDRLGLEPDRRLRGDRRPQHVAGR